MNASNQGLATFHLFSYLPKEMRDEIWKLGVYQPRLVHWRPGGGKAPALLTACKESRYWALPAYVLCFDEFRRKSSYGMYINFTSDTIYAKNDLPDQIKMKNVHLLPVNIIVPSPHPGRELNHKVWTRGIKSLVVNLDDAASVISSLRKRTTWEKLALMFPELEELDVMVSTTRVTKHHSLGDLVAANLPDLTSEEVEAVVLIRHQLDGFQTLPTPRFASLKLRFLTLREGACTDPDLPMKVPDNPAGQGARKKAGYVKPAHYMRRH